MDELVARQPIFTRAERVAGYELLFRSSLDNFFDGKDGEAATRAVADHLMTLGRTLTQGQPAFINCTAQFLAGDFMTLLPPSSTVVEILESVEPTPAVIAVCRRLKQAGYKIALDDFVAEERFQPFIELADIIKVDFIQTPPSVRQMMVSEFAPRGLHMLAEKVETRADFNDALARGFEYFQGHFFCRPQILVGRRLPAVKLSGLRILQVVCQPDPDLAEVERAITHDVAVCYKLLRYVNSPLWGLRSEVRSVRHALTLLGQDEVKKLVTLAVALSLSDDKPPELMATALVRARSCELVGSHLAARGLRLPPAACFLVGMFSVMDALLGRPMEEILEQIALPEATRGALLGGKNPLRDIYELVFAYEVGNWSAVSWYAEKLSVEETLMPAFYFDAVDWAKQIFEVSSSSHQPNCRSEVARESVGQP